MGLRDGGKPTAERCIKEPGLRKCSFIVYLPHIVVSVEKLKYPCLGYCDKIGDLPYLKLPKQ